MYPWYKYANTTELLLVEVVVVVVKESRVVTREPARSNLRPFLAEAIEIVHVLMGKP